MFIHPATRPSSSDAPVRLIPTSGSLFITSAPLLSFQSDVPSTSERRRARSLFLRLWIPSGAFFRLPGEAWKSWKSPVFRSRTGLQALPELRERRLVLGRVRRSRHPGAALPGLKTFCSVSSVSATLELRDGPGPIQTLTRQCLQNTPVRRGEPLRRAVLLCCERWRRSGGRCSAAGGERRGGRHRQQQRRGRGAASPRGRQRAQVEPRTRIRAEFRPAGSHLLVRTLEMFFSLNPHSLKSTVIP